MNFTIDDELVPALKRAFLESMTETLKSEGGEMEDILYQLSDKLEDLFMATFKKFPAGSRGGDDDWFEYWNPRFRKIINSFAKKIATELAEEL